MTAIYLTGFMGSGKTTIGFMLGEMTGLPVYDTDQEVEKAEGKSVSEIFADHGEAYFRRKETEVLRSLPVVDCIITVGGGTVLDESNRKWMYENGRTIFLDCELEEIKRRLVLDTSRPLIAENRMNIIEKLYNERLPVYNLAPIKVSTAKKTAESVCREILQRINPL